MKETGTGLLTAAELSAVLDVSEETVRRLAREGQIPCGREGRRTVFSLEDLAAFFAVLEGEGAA